MFNTQGMTPLLRCQAWPNNIRQSIYDRAQFYDETGHVYTLLDEMGLDKMA